MNVNFFFFNNENQTQANISIDNFDKNSAIETILLQSIQKLNCSNNDIKLSDEFKNYTVKFCEKNGALIKDSPNINQNFLIKDSNFISFHVQLTTKSFIFGDHNNPIFQKIEVKINKNNEVKVEEQGGICCCLLACFKKKD